MTKKKKRIFVELRLNATKKALELLNNYQPLPKTGNSVLENYSLFDDRIFPLTNLAVERYKKLVKIRSSKLDVLAEHLNQNRDKKFDIRKMKNNPDGSLIFKDKPEGRKRAAIRRLTYREWWTIGAAGALYDMLNKCSAFLTWLNNNPDATRNQRAKRINQIKNAWNDMYVEFESCLAQINTQERAQSGHSTAKKRATIQKWVLDKAHEICSKQQVRSKRQLADIILRDYYNPTDWDTPLKKDGELNTIYRWLKNDTILTIKN